MLCCVAHGNEFFWVVWLFHARLQQLHARKFQQDAIERGHDPVDTFPELAFRSSGSHDIYICAFAVVSKPPESLTLRVRHETSHSRPYLHQSFLYHPHCIELHRKQVMVGRNRTCSQCVGVAQVFGVLKLCEQVLLFTHYQQLRITYEMAIYRQLTQCQCLNSLGNLFRVRDSLLSSNEAENRYWLAEFASGKDFVMSIQQIV
jgi:hypothetical protein